MGGKVSKEHKAIIGAANRTKSLKASGLSLEEVPPIFSKIPAVVELWLQENALTDVPSDMLEQWGATVELFYCYSNKLSSFPEGVRALSALEEFNISANEGIAELPEDLPPCWPKVKQVYMNDLPLLSALPSTIGHWTALKVLHMNNCCLTELPDAIGQLTSLTMVSMNGNKLSSLPPTLSGWTRVEKLFMNDNEITALPVELSQMAALEKCYFSNNCITVLPAAMFEGPLAEVLDELYLVDNEISALPDTLALCKRLGKLYIDNNRVASIPDSISALNGLEIFHANGNEIDEVPSALGEMPNIKFIHLSNNSIRHLPSSLADLRELRAFEVEEGNELSDAAKAILAQVQESLVPAWTF